MIPPVREFLSACEFLSRRFAWDLSPHDDDLIEALVDAHVEAERLAHGSGDELASLFYACAAASKRLGDDYVTLIIIITLNHGTALGRQPVNDRRVLVRELARWAHEIARGSAEFDEVRAWLEERLPL